MEQAVEIKLPKEAESSKKKSKRTFWLPIFALFLGIVLGAVTFLGKNILEVTGVGYDLSDAILALKNGVSAEVATRPYNRGVDEALSSENFKAENLEIYYDAEFVEGVNFTERINQLTEVGYKTETINLINQKLSDDEIAWLEKQGYLKKLPEMLKLDYFRAENLERYLKEVRNNKTGVETAVIRVNIGLDLEPYDDATEVTDLDNLMLVNKYHFLGENFLPANLKAIRQDCVKNGQKLQLTEVAQVSFEEMCLAARKAGLSLVANSAYRGYREQEEVLKDSATQFGQEYAEEYVSRPGFSEHQTGLALDLAAQNSDYFPVTPEYQWALDNAAQFGFILRYPEGKTEITGFNPEAWHFRYVGKPIAEKITSQNLTLEEYLATHSDLF